MSQEQKRERGPNLSPEVRAIIKSIALQPIKERELVVMRIQETLEKLGYPVPAEDTLKREVSHERTHHNPQDEQWKITSPEDYPQYFPLETIPVLIQAWVYARVTLVTTFTVRQAKWVARLYACFPGDIEKLTSQATGFAHVEMLSEIIGGKFGSEETLLGLYEEITKTTVIMEGRDKILEVKLDNWLSRVFTDASMKKLSYLFTRKENKQKREGE